MAPTDGQVTLSPQAAIHAINQRIFETSLDLILVVDRQGSFIRVSPSARAIIGYDPAELVGRSAREILFPDDLENTRTEMRLARRGRQMRNFECRYVHRDGRAIPLSWTGVWSEPEQQHFFIGRDITDRRHTEERLRQAQRMDAIGQLTGGMAHDFNNILGIIIGNLEMVRVNRRLDPDDDELLGEAIEAGVLGASLISRLLAFARRQSLQPERVAVNDLVRSIVGLLGRTLGEHIPITVRLAADLWSVIVDPAQLESSLVNLATNARDAMPQGGQLSIATANAHLDADYAADHAELTPGDYVMIAVSDTGTGIPPDAMARIFEPFFTTKEPGKGTGLGLSMVFGFAKQSGGHINVYSEQNAGTTFRLYLPREPLADAAVLSPGQHQASTPDSGHGETVLVVEDNVAMRRVVRRQLTVLGYRVVEADTAHAALELLEREPATLMFSDIVMPGNLSGVDLARTVMERWPDMKIVLTSGFPDHRVGANGGSIPGIRVLGKPYRRDDLARLLREVLEAN
jgi:PAS domain S-box-containing protein